MTSSRRKSIHEGLPPPPAFSLSCQLPVSTPHVYDFFFRLELPVCPYSWNLPSHGFSFCHSPSPHLLQTKPYYPLLTSTAGSPVIPALPNLNQSVLMKYALFRHNVWKQPSRVHSCIMPCIHASCRLWRSEASHMVGMMVQWLQYRQV